MQKTTACMRGDDFGGAVWGAGGGAEDDRSHELTKLQDTRYKIQGNSNIKAFCILFLVSWFFVSQRDIRQRPQCHTDPIRNRAAAEPDGEHFDRSTDQALLGYKAACDTQDR